MANGINSAEKDDLAKLIAQSWEVADAGIVPYVRPDDVTARTFAEKHGITIYIARRILFNKVKAGELEAVKCRPPAGASGGYLFAYRKKRTNGR